MSLESSGARIEQLGRQMLLFGRPLDIDEVLAAVDRIDEAYATFGHKAVVPLRQIDANDWLLELFHGPTLAFKDVASPLTTTCSAIFGITATLPAICQFGRC